MVNLHTFIKSARPVFIGFFAKVEQCLSRLIGSTWSERRAILLIVSTWSERPFIFAVVVRDGQ